MLFVQIRGNIICTTNIRSVIILWILWPEIDREKKEKTCFRTLNPTLISHQYNQTLKWKVGSQSSQENPCNSNSWTAENSDNPQQKEDAPEGEGPLNNEQRSRVHTISIVSQRSERSRWGERVRRLFWIIQQPLASFFRKVKQFRVSISANFFYFSCSLDCI